MGRVVSTGRPPGVRPRRARTIRALPPSRAHAASATEIAVRRLLGSGVAMRRFEHDVEVAVAVEDVWRVYADVERWPEWTPSMRRVAYVKGRSLEIGARVRIEQPALPPMIWEVVALRDGVSWTWMNERLGLRTSASHEVVPTSDHVTRVRQAIELSGRLAPLVAAVHGSLTRRYLAMEGEGLRSRCERDGRRASARSSDGLDQRRGD